MFHAVDSADLELLKSLLKAGADPDSTYKVCIALVHCYTVRRNVIIIVMTAKVFRLINLISQPILR